jgi:hypothetical protein
MLGTMDRPAHHMKNIRITHPQAGGFAVRTKGGRA